MGLIVYFAFYVNSRSIDAENADLLYSYKLMSLFGISRAKDLKTSNLFRIGTYRAKSIDRITSTYSRFCYLFRFLQLSQIFRIIIIYHF